MRAQNRRHMISAEGIANSRKNNTAITDSAKHHSLFQRIRRAICPWDRAMSLENDRLTIENEDLRERLAQAERSAPW